MVALGWLLLIAGATLGYGDVAVRALRLRLPTRLERATLGIGLGTGCLVVIHFVLGLMHLMGRAASLLVIVPAAAFGIWRMVGAREAAPTPAAQPRWLRRCLWLALAACVVANVMGTLAPPSFVDALVYHLFIARTYVRVGGLVELRSIWQSYQPLGVEMLFALGFSLQGAVLAALAHTGLGLLVAGATWLIGRRAAGPAGGLWAAAIFYCTAMVCWESTSCFVELGITAFSTLGFYALLRWSDDEDPRWLIAAAFFMGVAGICKLTAIQFAVVAAGLVGWLSWRRRQGLGVILGRIAVFMGIALALGLPWYVHSYLWTGNPVYPFAPKIFGKNPDYDNVWLILNSYGPGHGPKDFLLAPWRLFSSGALFECAQYFSPLPFIVGPLIVLRLKGARDRQLLAAVVAIGFVLWFASAQVARYLIPLQPLLAVLAADAVCGVAAAGSRYRSRLVTLTGLLCVGFGTASTLLAVRPLLPVVLGRESVESYLTRTAVSYTAYRMVAADVPENGLILTNQGPTFYLDRPHVRVHDAEFLAGPDRVAKLIAGGNYTHIFVNGYPGMEASVMALGPRVKLLWHREIDQPVSRTFGGTTKVPATLFEIVR
jgi:hypothetical protein